MKKQLLGVSIDHIATLRQATGTAYPEPVHGAQVAEMSGADSIVVHLREDRSHIQDRDVYLLSHMVQTKLNLKVSLSEEMLNFAAEVNPGVVTLMPESADETTVSGGLDVVENEQRITQAVDLFAQKGIDVAVFIDADKAQIDAARAAGVCSVELNTGHYSESLDEEEALEELQELIEAAEHAQGLELLVSAGTGLHYHNVGAVAAIEAIGQINVGHAVISRSVFDGLSKAVADMKAAVAG